DGIRDFHVTGVQTCALPISSQSSWLETWTEYCAPPVVAAEPGDFADCGRADRDHDPESESHAPTCRKDDHTGQAWRSRGSAPRRVVPDERRIRGQAVRHHRGRRWRWQWRGTARPWA